MLELSRLQTLKNQVEACEHAIKRFERLNCQDIIEDLYIEIDVAQAEMTDILRAQVADCKKDIATFISLRGMGIVSDLRHELTNLYLELEALNVAPIRAPKKIMCAADVNEETVTHALSLDYRSLYNRTARMGGITVTENLSEGKGDFTVGWVTSWYPKGNCYIEQHLDAANITEAVDIIVRHYENAKNVTVS